MAPLKYYAIVALVALHVSPVWAADWLVHNQSEYRSAVKAAQPGDIIRLANGTWRDFRILFEGRGTAAKPIMLTAETKGKVVLSGASDLRIAGQHLIVSGLVFRDGSAPDKELISFRSDDDVANHVRLTEVVVDHFNKPDRRAEDIWVAIYGQDNRVDHSWFAGKGNAGVTLAVIRPMGVPQANHARIDHNYFGPRPALGSNGGETIRIGTSEESLSDSASIIEHNYFEQCDGEVEIISIKSGTNIVRENMIVESQGSIVLRHGNGNLVERNIILGHGKAHTGGVRVINRNQVVRGNYLEGLRGDNFTSAIAVMNGVPNSAINRYHQVAGARIEHNSFIDVSRITFGAGADSERTAAPVNSSFAHNLIASAGDIVREAGDSAGIAQVGNVSPTPNALKRAANGLLYAAGVTAGAPRDLRPLTRAEVGPVWYRPIARKAELGSGRTFAVPARRGELESAVAASGPGDTLRLAAGNYHVGAPIRIDRPLTITGPAEARLTFSTPTLFQLEEGGSLRLEGFTISGAAAPSAAGNAIIRSAPRSTIGNYIVFLSRMNLAGLDKAPGFDVIATTPSTKAARIEIDQSRFSDVSGTVVAAASETGKQGYYSAETITIANSRFVNVSRIADVARLGTDESTFGPTFAFSDNLVEGGGPKAIQLSGVQSTSITGNRFRKAGAIDIAHSVGAPVTVVECNQLVDTPMPRTTKTYPQGSPSVTIDHNGAAEDGVCASRS